MDFETPNISKTLSKEDLEFSVTRPVNPEHSIGHFRKVHGIQKPKRRLNGRISKDMEDKPVLSLSGIRTTGLLTSEDMNMSHAPKTVLRSCIQRSEYVTDAQSFVASIDSVAASARTSTPAHASADMMDFDFDLQHTHHDVAENRHKKQATTRATLVEQQQQIMKLSKSVLLEKASNTSQKKSKLKRPNQDNKIRRRLVPYDELTLVSERMQPLGEERSAGRSSGKMSLFYSA